MDYDSIATIVDRLSAEEIEAYRRKFRRSYASTYSHYEVFSGDPFATGIRVLVKDVLDSRLTSFNARLTFAFHQRPEYQVLIREMSELTEKLFEETEAWSYIVDSLQFSDWLPHWATVLEWENTVRSVLLFEAYESDDQQIIDTLDTRLESRLSIIVALDSLRKEYTTVHRLVQKHYRILFEESSFSSSWGASIKGPLQALADDLKPYRNQYFLHPRPALARTYVAAVNDRFNLDKLRNRLRQDKENASTLDLSFLDKLEAILVDLEVELILQNSN